MVRLINAYHIKGLTLPHLFRMDLSVKSARHRNSLKFGITFLYC